MDYSQRVKRGVIFLNINHPGWDEEIDLNDLNLQSSCNCVLGQLYGTYANGMRKNGLWATDTIEKGFSLKTIDATQENWSALNAAWKEAIIEQKMESKKEEIWVGAEDKESELVSV